MEWAVLYRGTLGARVKQNCTWKGLGASASVGVPPLSLLNRPMEIQHNTVLKQPTTVEIAP